MAKSASGIIVSWFFAVLAIILLVLLANFIVYVAPYVLLVDIVSFLNKNVLLLIFASVFYYAGALFFSGGSPLNLLTPPADGFGSVFIVAFFVNFIVLLDDYAYTGIGALLEWFAIWIYIIVFVLVVLLGYLHIAHRSKRRARRVDEHHYREASREETVEEKPSGKKRVLKKSTKRVVRK